MPAVPPVTITLHNRKPHFNTKVPPKVVPKQKVKPKTDITENNVYYGQKSSLMNKATHKDQVSYPSCLP